jgi:hypothetical protein
MESHAGDEMYLNDHSSSTTPVSSCEFKNGMRDEGVKGEIMGSWLGMGVTLQSCPCIRAHSKATPTMPSCIGLVTNG